MLQINEQDEIARKFISNQYDADYANNLNVLQNSYPSIHYQVRDYFHPLEISILFNEFDPTYFLYNCETGFIQFKENSSITEAFKDICKYDSLFDFLSFEQKVSYRNIINYQLGIIPKITNMHTIICDAISHNDINYDTLKYHDFVTNYKENLIKLHKNDIRDFLIKKGFSSSFFETTANESDFYKIPKNHKCVTPKTKALIETLLHFIENETELHDAQSGVRDTIADYIIANNRYIIPETAIKKEIAPIINWTHKKEIQKT